MSWRIEWTALATRDFYALPHWEGAARVDEAILRLAEGRQANVRRMSLDGHLEVVILAPPYAILVAHDRSRQAIIVRRIIRYA